MLEIIILTLIIILAFALASWYSYKRSQDRARAFERELDLSHGEHGSEEFQQRFDELFEQELHSQEEDDFPEPGFSAVIDDSDDDEAHMPDMFEQPQPETGVETVEQSEPVVEPESETETDDSADITQNVNDWDMVIALTIMAPESKSFTGRAVKAALDSHDLHFGDMQIYHRYSSSARKQVLFSVANMIDPGTLLPDSFVSMNTPGLLIFARLPGPMNGMALFDELLDTALGITSQLDGVLCDDTREPITDAGLEAMRSRILNYQMSLQAEKNQQSNDYFN